MASTDPFDFPCDFPIKAFGWFREDFDALIVSLIRRHASRIKEGGVRTRMSRGGRYLAVTVTIEAESREQLDAIYRELSASPLVLMAL